MDSIKWKKVYIKGGEEGERRVAHIFFEFIKNLGTKFFIY